MVLLVLAYLGFVSVGLPDGAHGVAWPYMASDFGVPVGSVGWILVAGTTGYVSASVAAGFLVSRIGVGWLLAGSTLLSALALVGYATAPGLVAVVVAALLLGWGSGAVDAGLNAYVTRHFAARHISWLHASFGAGATAGPLVMTAMIAAGLAWRWGYGSLAAGLGLLALAFLLTAGRWVDGSAVAPVQPPSRQTWRLPGLWLGAAGFAVQVAIEIATALWAFLLLTERRGMAEELAGLAVSAYWGCMFVGRLVSGAVTDRLGPHRLLAAGVTGLLLGAVLVTVPAPGWLAVVGLVVLGFAAAPMFPLLTLTTKERVGDEHADRTIGVQTGASALGGAAVPAAIGVLIDHTGPEALGPCLIALAALLALIYGSSRRIRLPARLVSPR
ncbi:MAG TPA: MFS transporter [Natronosporangium sp.]